MSQEKVDKYKEYKKNKKKILKKEKNKALAEKLAAYAVGFAIIAAIIIAAGMGAVNSYKSYLSSRPNYDRTAYVLSDFSGVLETETETETQTEAN